MTNDEVESLTQKVIELQRQVKDLEIRNNTLEAAVRHYKDKVKSLLEDLPEQYTWGKAMEQFKDDRA